MEDDVLHFPRGVLVDNVIGAGLVGIVALREDRKLSLNSHLFLDLSLEIKRLS
jgi:fluoride ion exporter CrcB/FEX